jgi:23S rRNA (cytidine1920-2'-O)/16S rRNA (cytidine1409-2'-O)-methyltransferase
MRLDQLVAARGLAPSRARARDAIIRGHVSVDGERQRRPGAAVDDGASIEIDDPAARFVSRSALKLLAALDHFGFDPAGRVAIDLGASTGGFTQVLLERGARRIHAVDVGHGQIDARLAADKRVRLLEGVNARALAAEMIGELAGVLVSDVSFISQRLALPPALSMCAPGAFAVVLAKPQFEVGADRLGKGGIVRDPEAGRAAAQGLARWVGDQPGWLVKGLIPAPISGSDGNQEYLIGAVFR